MRTEGDCQSEGKKGRKIPCLGSTTFIWAFYLFCLQALGKHFNWKFPILQKMHLPCADCTTSDLGGDCDHKNTPQLLSSAVTHRCLPLNSSLHSTESKGWSHLLTRRSCCWDMDVKSSSMCNPAFATQLQGAWQNSPSLLSWPTAELSTIPYMEHKPCSCSSRSKTGISWWESDML